MAVYYVIPCSGDKAPHPAPARDLYRGQMFLNTLRTVLHDAERTQRELGFQCHILIMSAKYGLVELGQVIAPYDCTIRDEDSVPVEALTAQAQALGIDWEGDEVYCLLPIAYFRKLDEALRTLDVYAHNVYEAIRGIGTQRFINKCIVKY